MRLNFLVTNIDKGERGKCFNNCDEGRSLFSNCLTLVYFRYVDKTLVGR